MFDYQPSSVLSVLVNLYISKCQLASFELFFHNIRMKFLAQLCDFIMEMIAG